MWYRCLCCRRVHDSLHLPTVFVSEPMSADTPQAEESERYGELLLAGNDSSTLHVRSERPSSSFWMCPPHSSLGEPDGVFTKHTVTLAQAAIPTPAVKLTKPAAPPRCELLPLFVDPVGSDALVCGVCSKVPVNAHSHKAQEPTAEEWAEAAEFKVTLSLPAGWAHQGNQTTELTLAIDYVGDAARLYYKDRACLNSRPTPRTYILQVTHRQYAGRATEY